MTTRYLRKGVALEVLMALALGGCSDEPRELGSATEVGPVDSGPDTELEDAGLSDRLETADVADLASADAAGPRDMGVGERVCGAPGEVVASEAQLAALVGCAVYVGDAILLVYPIDDIYALRSLRVVEGLFSAGRNSRLPRLDGLERLERAEGLSIGSFVEDVRGLRGLRHVGRRALAFIGSELTELAGFEQLETIEGSLEFSLNSKLESLDGLRALESVGGDLHFQSNPRLPRTAIDAFVARVRVAGRVTILP